ncbi:multidrug transporter subunit MdtN [Xanthobacter sp. TB0139]|uniref:multidrug transporter subunit MdtN n=1 Tax=Xanthobacter sp. TB0139 TaxID=3459178 RepID=UPI0040399D24
MTQPEKSEQSNAAKVGTNAETTAASATAQTHSPYAGHKARPIGLVVAAVIIVAAGVLGWLYLQRAENYPTSKDAIIVANTVNISSIVPGRIIAIHAKENGRVRKGDLLFELDPAPLQHLVDQTRADLELAEAALETQHRSIAAEKANAEIADQQITRARTNLALTEATLARLTALAPKGYVTRQQVDDARTLRDDAEVSLAQAIKQKEAADKLVTSAASGEALVRARRAALAMAQYNLENAKVYAPHDGLVVGLHTSSGEFVISGQSLFTLIDTANWYASAAFDETELPLIRAGNCGRVYILADSARPVKGVVEGIGWGVTSAELINLPRALPYVPKTLNWVRIAQRFPVRVRLLDPPEDLTRIGASAVVTVLHGTDC